MHRRVILVELYWTRDHDPRVPLGHASLLASLRSDPSIDARSVVVPVNMMRVMPEELATTILREAAGVPDDKVDIAVGVYVWAEEVIQELIPALRRAGFAGRVIFGGPQISYSGPGVAALYPGADAFLRGFGEAAILELARCAGRPCVPGVVYAGEDDSGEQAVADLNDLPSPWLGGAIPLRGQRFVRWETQRGCPFRCSFCQHREPGARLPRRELSETRVMQEVDLFCSAGVEDIAVLDPIFNIGRLFEPVLDRFVQRGFRGRLSLQCRAELVTGTFLDAAARLNARLEFGLQTIHREESAAVERGNDLAKVDATLAEVRRRGMAHEVSLIFGLPGQTVESFVESVRWCLARRVPVLKAFPLMLLRGTKLERERERWGLVESRGPMPVVVASSTFDPEQWRAMARLSEALKRTEGHHPDNVWELGELAADLEPEFERWRPKPRSCSDSSP